MISQVSATPQQTASLTQALSDNNEMGKDAFLRLLTTQLQNQDPMDPVKNEDFVAQLAQFSSLEQLQNINQTLSENQNPEVTFGVEKAIQSNTAVSLIGKNVEISTETVTYTGDGSVEIGYHLEGPANRVDIQIFDGTGNLIHTLTDTSPEVGNGSIKWNGKDGNNQQTMAGTYHIIPYAVNGENNSVIVSATLMGEVTELRHLNGNPILIINGSEAPLSSVTRISKEN